MLGKIIVISSGKGGVGKTTATASIGAALAMEGKKVAVVDMDIGLRNLDVVMGLENRVVFNIVDVARGKCKVRQAAIKDRRIDNLFLFNHPVHKYEFVESENFRFFFALLYLENL